MTEISHPQLSEDSTAVQNANENPGKPAEAAPSNSASTNVGLYRSPSNSSMNVGTVQDSPETVSQEGLRGQLKWNEQRTGETEAAKPSNTEVTAVSPAIIEAVTATNVKVVAESPAHQTQAANPSTETGNAAMGGVGGGMMFGDLPPELQQSYSTLVTLLNNPGYNPGIIDAIQCFQSAYCDSIFFNNNLTNLHT